MKTDEQLFATYTQTHDQAAFVELHDRYRPQLLQYLRRFFGDGPGAEDTLQQLWLKAAESPEQFVPGGKLSSWIYRVAYTCAIDVLRQSGRDVVKPASTCPETTPDDRARVQATLATMDKSDNRLIAIMFHERGSFEQAAAELGQTVNHTRVQLFRILTALRSELAA